VVHIRVVFDCIAVEQVVMAFGGLVTGQDTIGIALCSPFIHPT